MSITSLPSRIICRIHAAFSSNDHSHPASQSSIVSAPIIRAYLDTRCIFSPITTGFSSRLACRAPRVSAAPLPARSSAAFSIPTPNAPSARSSEAKSSISSAIWANSASHKHFQECEALQRSIRAFRSLSRLLMCFWLIRPSTVHSWMIRTNSSTSKLSALSETFLTKLKNCE
jgi:hypothetical protein